jgi:hypothetical protein
MRIVDLCQWVYEEFRVVVAKQTLSREFARNRLSQALGPSPPSCSGHRRDRDFKKSSRLQAIGCEEASRAGAIEIWFADEARVVSVI